MSVTGDMLDENRAEGYDAGRASRDEEVAALQEQLRLANEISAKVNAAINRAGIHCALYYWEAIDRMAAERDALRAALREACEIASSEDPFDNWERVEELRKLADP